MPRRLFIAAAAAAGDTSADTPYTCNILGDPSVSCMLPWPDNFFLTTAFDSNATLGLRLTNTTFPVDANGGVIGVEEGGWTKLQGFSPMGPYMAYIPNLNLDLSGSPRFWNISSSVHPSATSLLLETSPTPTPVTHWMEVDHSADLVKPDGDYERALFIWPAARLKDATRYIVAFRDLVDDNGLPIQPSDGFRALRDKIATNDPAIEASRPRFESIFQTLQQLGWARESLTLAWDFTTNTREDLTATFVSMRDDAFQRVQNGRAIQYAVTSVANNPRAGIARSIQGWFNAPLYLNQATPGINVRLVLDETTGLPVYQGMTQVNFTVLIPSSLAGNATVPPHPAKVVQYGHGLFGSQDEVNTGYLDDEANTYGYVLGAVDWWGLTDADEPYAAVMVATDFTNFPMIPDRVHQGMLNALLLMKFMTQSAFVQDPTVVFGGVSVISTNSSDWHYYGNSDGGILGQVYMGVTTDVVRGVSGVGGGPYTLLLPRSVDFAALFDIIRLRYPRPIDAISLLAVIQALWDRMDPSGYLHAISADPLPNTPAHTILLQGGLGDAQVTWLGVETSGRSVGASAFVSMVSEGNETLSGFNFVPDSAIVAGTGANAIQLWDFGVPLVPFVNLPPSSQNDTHEKTRRAATAQAQMARFFYAGEIVNTCGGPCFDPNATMRGEYL